MPTNPTRSMTQRLAEAQRALTALHANSALSAVLRRVGYGAERLQEGEALLAGVELAAQQADERLDEQRRATRALAQQRRQLERALRDAVQLARVALGEGAPWLEAAGIPPRRARGEGPAPSDNSLEGLLARASHFFQSAHTAPPDVRAALSEVGLGQAALAMGMGLISAVQRASEAQARAAERTAQAVQVRSNAFETLDDWMRGLVTAARVALRDRPALLVELGIRPRGRPRKG